MTMHYMWHKAIVCIAKTKLPILVPAPRKTVAMTVFDKSMTRTTGHLQHSACIRFPAQASGQTNAGSCITQALYAHADKCVCMMMVHAVLSQCTAALPDNHL